MINIHITDRIIKKHKEYIKNSSIEKNIKNLINDDYLILLKDKYGEDFEREHIKFCDYLLKQYFNLDKKENENIFLGKPEYLYKVIKKVKKEYHNIDKIIQEDKEYSKDILEAFEYQKFVDSHGWSNKNIVKEEFYRIDNFQKDIDNFKWGAYAYVLSLKVKVCPYCNRNYVTPLYSEKGKMRADLDHFFAKNRYPYLSISLFNLVPSCKYCNSSLKGKKEFTYLDNFHPFDNIEADDLYRMTYTPKDISCCWGEESFDIEIEYNYANENWKKIKGNNDIFRIEEIYQYHKDIVVNLIKKKYIYDDAYIEYLWKSYPDLFSSREEVVDFLIASYDISEVENAPLGRLLKDLIEEMSF